MSVPYDSPNLRKPPDGGSASPDGRIHISARHRGVDATALGTLALQLPQMLMSTAVVLGVVHAVDVLFGPPWWIPLGCWAVSGGLSFSRPFERLMARWLYGLRYPTPEENRKLKAGWREVTARAGVDGSTYQLWVEDSDATNAMAAAGHIVGVTTHSLRTLTPAQLAGVLAHELGHHVGGHAWVSLITSWYTLPGRIAWRLLRLLSSRIDRLSASAAALVIGVLGAAVLALASATYGLVFLLLTTPYLAAAVARRSELRADEHAAGLGFGPELMAVLSEEHDRAEPRPAAAKAMGVPLSKPGVIARLLASHPDIPTRLHRLRVHLDSGH